MSLLAFAASTNFEKEPDETDTQLISCYLRWRRDNDEQREQYHTVLLMLKLCNWLNDKKIGGPRRCELQKNDRLANFLFKSPDPASYILSFFGEKRGKGDLRDVSKYELYPVALEMDAQSKYHLWWTN